MNKIKAFLCKIGFHNWNYSIGHIDLVNRCGFDWKECKWCKKSGGKVEWGK